jgi:hypothetical protein
VRDGGLAPSLRAQAKQSMAAKEAWIASSLRDCAAI